jgi:hypothetical protein
MERFRGALDREEYLPNMSEGERLEADALVRMIGQFDWAPPWFR